MFLLVGGDSEIGNAACAYLRARGRATVATTRRPAGGGDDRIPLDLAGDLARWEPPPGTQAACIFAAVTRLAACAADPLGSAKVNVTGTLDLVQRLVSRGIHVLFLSTNQVFDGSVPHVPADAPTSPVSEYGRQKARTEAALRTLMDQGAPVAILRLAKVITPQTALLRDWSTALAAGKSIRAFHDMTVAPAPVETVTAAIEALLSERTAGVFQLTGPRDVTYVEVARFLATRLGADNSLVTSVGFATAGLPTGAAPPNTTLDSSALRERYGIAVADAWESIGAILSGSQITRDGHRST
jgi:dTDP-4-dehydrorhamnose reductase